MERFALLVDAGYFFAAGAEVAFGSGVPRREIRLVDPERAVRDLHEQAAALCGDLQLLRVYWYDAMPGPSLSLEQSELALQSGLKLRLGVLNNVGQQKGVDSLVVTDLIDLARNRAVVDAVLLSGDEDLRVGVQIAQSFGLRIHLWGAGNTAHNVSRSLRMEADSFTAIDNEWFVRRFERVADPRSESGAGQEPSVFLEAVEGESLQTAADRVSRELLSDLDARGVQQLVAVFKIGQSVPLVYDRRLIAMTARLMGGTRFSPSEMRDIRGVFVTVVQQLADHGAATAEESA
jgi:hypothetical protein